jgi:hypothetical protein
MPTIPSRSEREGLIMVEYTLKQIAAAPTLKLGKLPFYH